MKALQRDLAKSLAELSEVYRVLDTTPIPAVVGVRACRKGLFAGQAAFGRCISKTGWIYGFEVALSVSPGSIVTAFGPANRDERLIGEFLVAPTATTAISRTKASPRRNGSGTGWRPRGLS
jgi:hypothetical protein